MTPFPQRLLTRVNNYSTTPTSLPDNRFRITTLQRLQNQLDLSICRFKYMLRRIPCLPTNIFPMDRSVRTPSDLELVELISLEARVKTYFPPKSTGTSLAETPSTFPILSNVLLSAILTSGVSTTPRLASAFAKALEISPQYTAPEEARKNPFLP